MELITFIAGLWLGAAGGWLGCSLYIAGKADEAAMWRDRYQAEHDDHQRTIAHADAIERHYGGLPS